MVRVLPPELEPPELPPGLQAVTNPIAKRAVKQAVSQKRSRFIAIQNLKEQLGMVQFQP